MDRLSEITSILADDERRAALTDDEVAALEAELLALFDSIRAGEVEDIERDDTERLREVAAGIEVVRTLAGERMEAAEARAAEIAEIEALIRPEPEVTEPEPEPVPEPVAEAEPVEAVEEPAEEQPAEPEPVLASAPLGRAAQRIPSRFSPVVGEGPRDRTLRLIREGRNVPWAAFVENVLETRESFGGYQGGGVERIRLGRIDVRDRYPEERRLSGNDSLGVTDRKMSALAAAALDGATYRDPEVQALVASGGFCAPTPAEYDLAQISGAQRPVRDGLPSFNVDRGGIRFTPPPDLSDVLTDDDGVQAGSAVGVWTHETDASPSEATKPTQTVACGTPTEELTDAITKSLRFGNFMGRAYPEWVSTWMDNALAAWARVSESRLLTRIGAASTSVTTTQLLGTTRDLVSYVAQLAAAERNRQRMAPDARLRVWFPAWVIASMQIDQIREGYNRVTDPITEATVRGWFSTLNINVSFYEDSASGAGQIVAAQGAGADLRDLPITCEWYLSHEGAHTFLDGGVLDLGLVRSPELNEVNDYMVFAESFEGYAYRGIFSYKVRSTICPDGAGAQVQDTDGICSAS